MTGDRNGRTSSRALIVMAAAARNRARWLVASFVVAVVATVLAFHRLSEWDYWAPMVILLGIGLACGWPGREALGFTGRPRGGAPTHRPAPVEGPAETPAVGSSLQPGAPW
jgi:hypothetical protein